MKLNEISERVIGCAFAVSNGLGSGFLKKVYKNAQAHELRKAALSVVQQHAMVARYDGVVVGQYVADLLAGSLVLVELKHARGIDDVHLAQCLNHLR
jgi:GxxExxY protein